MPSEQVAETEVDLVECCYCHEMFPERRMRLAVSGSVCPSCYNETMHCANCGYAMRGDEISETEVDGTRVCTRCFEDAGYCDNCEEYTLRDTLRTANNDRICQSCYENNFFTCDGCGDVYHMDNSVESRGNIYCEGCAGRHGHFINTFDGMQKLRDNEPGKRTLGVEIECATTPEENAAVEERGVWSATEDGSLHMTNSIEYVSPIMAENNFEEEIKRHIRQIPNSSVESCCGLHIHLGTADLSWWELLNFLNYCIKYEDFFFGIVSQSRRDNSYCKRLPVFLPKITTKAGFIAFMYGRPNMHTRQSDKYPSARGGRVHRYWWINIHSHFYRKTIEIRLHQGSVNATKIINWFKLWLKIIPVAIKGEQAWKPPSEIIGKELLDYYKSRNYIRSTVFYETAQTADQTSTSSIFVSSDSGTDTPF